MCIKIFKIPNGTIIYISSLAFVVFLLEYYYKQDNRKQKLHSQLSSTDLFGDDDELSSDDEEVSGNL